MSIIGLGLRLGALLETLGNAKMVGVERSSNRAGKSLLASACYEPYHQHSIGSYLMKLRDDYRRRGPSIPLAVPSIGSYLMKHNRVAQLAPTEKLAVPSIGSYLMKQKIVTFVYESASLAIPSI